MAAHRSASRLYSIISHLGAKAPVIDSNCGYITSHDPIANPPDTANFLNNAFVPSAASQWIDLKDPATNQPVTRVPKSTDEEL
jgi:malonate-semialdehyde dehydrogenase (acetylating)/methylmalonate-semialdehyde dehydrogenase